MENLQQAIERVQQMEQRFDLLQAAANTEPNRLFRDGALREELRILLRYYENGRWLRDYELDEQGFFPQDLKRGVLSQDGVYNLLAQIQSEAEEHFSCLTAETE